MKIFLSYPSAHRVTAESVCYGLQAEGHEVFFDKDNLPSAQGYNERIREAIQRCDLLIWLITPQAIEKGRYTLTELKLASRKWPNPVGHVLPVMLEPTPFDDLPPYLAAVTVLTPEGDVTAEILLEVSELTGASDTPPKREDDKDMDLPGLPDLAYRPVRIRFTGGDEGYSVAITDSPVGAVPARGCDINPAKLEEELWSSAGPVAGTLRRARPGQGGTDSLLPSAQDLKHVGEELHRVLFTAPLGAELERSLRSVDPQHGQGLRFLIDTTNAPGLARLPWEFLYDPGANDFLFSDRMKPVIRWLDVDQPPPSLAVEPPLRLLMAIAAPTNRPELAIGEEIAHLDASLEALVDQGVVETVRLGHTSLETLDDALLRHQPHVLHFIGHGDFVGDEGSIMLETDPAPGKEDPITGSRLGVLLRNHLGSLRFVFLNSCLGGAVSARDPFGGVAQSLIRRGVPAVVAMQFPIPDRAATDLARHFYRYLATGLPVDAALTSSRAFMYARGYQVEWGAPALYMRTPDGRLFDVVAQAPANAVTPAPSLRPAPPSDADDGRVTHSAAEAPQRRKRWTAIWAALAAVLLFGFLILNQFGNREQPASEPAASAEPSAGEPYQDVLGSLEAGDVPDALVRLEEAMEIDPDGFALDVAPDLRGQLVDALEEAAETTEAPGLAVAVADALLSVDPDNEIALGVLDGLTPDAAAAPEPTLGYRVEPGDSLWAIAGAEYGDSLRWTDIYEANLDTIADPDLIYSGQELRMPSGQAVSTAHRVAVGESLWRIAAATYGDPRQWPVIYEANRDQIQDPDLIYPDQVLVVP